MFQTTNQMFYYICCDKTTHSLRNLFVQLEPQWITGEWTHVDISIVSPGSSKIDKPRGYNG